MIAIIPARGGSKGLPGKNIRLLSGKPLIAYTVEAALKANEISRVIVSTDDEEIAAIALKFGAEVPSLRPKYLATDTANAVDVYNYVLDSLEEQSENDINEIIVLLPTSPFRTTIHIKEAIQLYKRKNADSVISYCKEEHPIFWHKFITDEGKFEEIFEGDYLKNRQEIKETYYPNGAIYIFKTDLIRKNKYVSDNSYAYLMDRKSSIDIDVLEDFEYAEFIILSNK